MTKSQRIREAEERLEFALRLQADANETVELAKEELRQLRNNGMKKSCVDAALRGDDPCPDCKEKRHA